MNLSVEKRKRFLNNSAVNRFSLLIDVVHHHVSYSTYALLACSRRCRRYWVTSYSAAILGHESSGFR